MKKQDILENQAKIVFLGIGSNLGQRKINIEKAKKNAPRTCDLDIIDFNKLVSKKNSKINLPHKMMHKRNFVLFPLFEIQKNWIHPDKQIDVKTLISLLPDRDIRSIKQI